MEQLGNTYENMTNEQLFEEYSRTKSLEVKQEIALRYLQVIKTIAVQMKNLYMGVFQVEDIVQDGVMELLKLIDKYDPDKNARFESYLSVRIRGMVIDRLRKVGSGVRGIQKNLKEIEKAEQHLWETEGRWPEEKRVAEYMGMTLDEYAEIMQKKSIQKPLSMENTAWEGQSGALLQAEVWKQPEECYLKNEELEVLADAISCLGEKEKLVISLYYVEELKMKEIAEVMNVSRPRISRIHADALRKLKTYMEKELQA